MERRNATSATINYVLNANNLVVAGFASLLVLLLLSFILGAMYICAKLRGPGRQQACDVGDTDWEHSSFSRGAGSSAAATAVLYRPSSSAAAWDAVDSLRRRQDDMAQTTALARDRPAFYGRTEARVTPTVVGVAGVVRGGSANAAAPVRAFLPRVAELPQAKPPRCQSIDDQAYDTVQLQRLALSGPFVNEHAGSCDSLSGVGASATDGGNLTEYQSEEYLDVLVKK